MNRRVTLLQPDTREIYLMLENVKPEVGEPESGYVINGGWHWSRVDGVEYAKDDAGFVRAEFPAVPWVVVEDTFTKPATNDDYDDLIAF